MPNSRKNKQEQTMIILLQKIIKKMFITLILIIKDQKVEMVTVLITLEAELILIQKNIK